MQVRNIPKYFNSKKQGITLLNFSPKEMKFGAEISYTVIACWDLRKQNFGKWDFEEGILIIEFLGYRINVYYSLIRALDRDFKSMCVWKNFRFCF